MSTHSNAPRIFVSHSHVDAAFAAQLVEDLRQAHTQAWMDTTDLGAGDFQERISAALAGCEWFVLVLTKDALASQWVRQEVNAASRLRHHGQIHDLIFIKAGPVEQRDLPPLWGVYNIFDATTNYAAALAAVLTSVGMSSPLSVLTPQPQQSVPMTPPSAPPIAADHFPQRLASLGFTGHAALVNGKSVEYIVPPLCEVPAGSFLMGDDQHAATVSAFAIARYLVTVAEYACFVRAGYQPPQEDSYLHLTWEQQLLRLDHPIVNVSWQDATAYATWLAERTGQFWRLPTETEWEKAARGTDGRIYPWGDTFDKSRCNTYESGIKTTTPVGSYPSGASPYGVQDMAGNAWEWTDSRYDNSTGNRVLHGGSWGGGSRGACVACRLVNLPSIFLGRVGVRLVVASPETSPPTPFPKRKGP